MNPELITQWAEHDSAVQKTLLLATRSIRIFDTDLARLRLESRENTLFLRRFLTAAPRTTLQIVLRDAEPFRRSSPRLFNLLGDYSSTMTVTEYQPTGSALNDSMLLADDCHALIRFHKDHVRSNAIIENPDECRGYLVRFQEIQNEGGTAISATTLGL